MFKGLLAVHQVEQTFLENTSSDFKTLYSSDIAPKSHTLLLLLQTHVTYDHKRFCFFIV